MKKIEENIITEPKNVIEIIDKTDRFLDGLFRRVTLREPYYQQARVLQRDILRFKESLKPQSKIRYDKKNLLSESAKAFRKGGLTIREIAQILGYKHPGSISHLLSKKTKS